MAIAKGGHCMTIKQSFANLRKQLEDESLDHNMVESFIESVESVENFILNKFDRRQIVLVHNYDEIDKIVNAIGRDYYIEFDSGYDFYCRVVETVNMFTEKSTLYLFLYDLNLLR